MNLRQYLSVMGIATVISWVAWGIVLFEVDPYTAGLGGMSFFYLSLFLALSGTGVLFLYPIHKLLARRSAAPAYVCVHKSARDAAFIAAVTLVLFWLQSQQLLMTPTTGIFIALVILLTVFFFTLRRSSTPIES